MPAMNRLAVGASMAAAAATVAMAQSISEIVGDAYLSPYADEDVTGVEGVVTAKGPDGIWIQEATGTNGTSAGIYLYGGSLANDSSIAVGDSITIDGTVSEYRSSDDYLPLTEITGASVTSNRGASSQLGRRAAVTPLVIGQDTALPPTEQFSSLDGGDIFAVPNNQSLVSVENPTLDPSKYGMDFWESLTGQLVTVQSPIAVSKPNQYGEVWVTGADWTQTGTNGRSGLTITAKDANPETIQIGSPLDGTTNPTDSKLGDALEDITGVVTYQYGFYQILPETAVSVLSSQTPSVSSPTDLTSTGDCSGLTVGGYNVENFYPGDTEHVSAVAAHIVDYLGLPDLLAVQEVQDDNGETDDGTVSSDESLQALADAISDLSGGQVDYEYTYISPVDNADGGAPGGNIRVAYLYNPSVLALSSSSGGNGTGDATTAVEVLAGPNLSLNPGLIDPTNAAWDNSRKPLVAQWDTVDGSGLTLFTVNVHFGSKGGSSSLQGDARPPVNGGVEDRAAQAEVTASLIAEILAEDPEALVLAVGDFNEFSVVQPLVDFMEVSGLRDLVDVVDVEDQERYSYLYDMNSQELDHVFVSPGLAGSGRTKGFSRLHLNTWVEYDAQVSDHDPSVSQFDVCA